MTQQTGKILMIAGVILLLAGLLVYFFGNRLNFPGRLPGDIRIEGENSSFYFPLTTGLLLSLLLSLIVMVARWFLK